MEDRRDHRTSLGVASAFLVLGFLATPASAQEGPPPFKAPPTVVVTTQPDSAVVEAEAKESVSGKMPTKVAGRRKCYLEPDVTNVGYDNTNVYGAHPDERSFYLYCDGAYVGIVWRKIDNGADPSKPVPPREVAMNIRDEIPIPQVTVRVNPNDGLVGSESWFWIEGYSGQPISESTDAFGQLVDVEASVTRFEWGFGDGVTTSSLSPGRAYPERSEVRHVYERSSAGTREGYPVQVAFVFAVRYRVGGGPWIELPGITRSTSVRYTVRESQAVIRR